MSVGDEVFVADQPADFMYWVIEGKVTLAAPSGDQKIVAGDTCGEEALQAEGVYAHKAHITEKALVVRLAADWSRNLFAGSSAGARSISFPPSCIPIVVSRPTVDPEDVP